MYNYPIYSISIHFGQREDGSGSEHTIDGQNFVAEVRQISVTFSFGQDIKDSFSIDVTYISSMKS